MKRAKRTGGPTRVRRRIVWGFLVLAFLAVVGTIGGFYAAGYRAYVIHTGSMAPTLVPGDLIIDRPANDNYQTGDIITFRHGPTPDLVTHRITSITADGIHTKGDANRTADVWTIPKQYVEGVVNWTVPALGYAVVFLQQPTGFASLAVILIGLVLLWQLFFPAGPTTRAGPADDAQPVEHEPADADLPGTFANPDTDSGGRHQADREGTDTAAAIDDDRELLHVS